MGKSADLLTLVRDGVPLFAVLRHDLGQRDPESARLRYVWALDSTRPGFVQRMAAALPFFYWRAPAVGTPRSAPQALFDLSNPRNLVYQDLGMQAIQLLALDPSGRMVRASSRSYGGHSRDYRRIQLMESLAVLSDLEKQGQSNWSMTELELRSMQARVKLATQTFGGLVSDRRLPDAYFDQREKDREARGHNWELVRQEAEPNGLYFQPLGPRGKSRAPLCGLRERICPPPEARRNPTTGGCCASRIRFPMFD